MEFRSERALGYPNKRTKRTGLLVALCCLSKVEMNKRTRDALCTKRKKARPPAPPKMHGLDDLPIELVYAILQQPVLRGAHLAAIACVNRAFCGIVHEVSLDRLRHHCHAVAGIRKSHKNQERCARERAQDGDDAYVDVTRWMAILNNAIAVDDPLMTKAALVIGGVQPETFLPPPRMLAHWTTDVYFVFMRCGTARMKYDPLRGSVTLWTERQAHDIKDDVGSWHGVSRLACDSPLALHSPIVRAIDCMAPRALSVLLRAWVAKQTNEGGPPVRPPSGATTEFYWTRFLQCMWINVSLDVCAHSITGFDGQDPLFAMKAPYSTRMPDRLAVARLLRDTFARSPTLSPTDPNPLAELRIALSVSQLAGFADTELFDRDGADALAKANEAPGGPVEQITSLIHILLDAGYSPDERLSGHHYLIYSLYATAVRDSVALARDDPDASHLSQETGGTDMERRLAHMRRITGDLTPRKLVQDTGWTESPFFKSNVCESLADVRMRKVFSDVYATVPCPLDA